MMIYHFLFKCFFFVSVTIYSSSCLPTTAPTVFQRISQEFPTDLDRNLGDLLGNVRNFTRNVHDVAYCYVDQIHGDAAGLNIFNRSLRFRTIVEQYYSTFPSKPITSVSISRLLNATSDIITRCLDQNQNGLQFGFTQMSDQVFHFFSNNIGDRLRRRNRPSRRDMSECDLFDRSTHIPLAFDWRDHGAVTPARDQKICGSCWVMAAVGTLESALLVHQKTNHSSITLDLSEQQFVNCANGCIGGDVDDAYEYIMANGITFEDELPYEPFNKQPCSHTALGHRIFPLRGYCWKKDNSDEDMLLALLQHGPLDVGLNAEAIASGSFIGGVIDSPTCSPSTLNHAAVLVGYTPSAWILKNSWGPWYGENGFFRVARNKNMCGINSEMAFPLLI